MSNLKQKCCREVQRGVRIARKRWEATTAAFRAPRLDRLIDHSIAKSVESYMILSSFGGMDHE